MSFLILIKGKTHPVGYRHCVPILSSLCSGLSVFNLFGGFASKLLVLLCRFVALSLFSRLEIEECYNYWIKTNHTVVNKSK